MEHSAIRSRQLQSARWSKCLVFVDKSRIGRITSPGSKCSRMRNGPYELVKAPPEYPGKKYRGKYVYEHHLVWWQHTGNVVRDGFLVHHVNEQKRDNRPENLQEITVAEHNAGHNTIDCVSVLCFRCRVVFQLKPSIFRQRSKESDRLFCGRSCQVKQQQYERKLVPR